MAKATFCFIRCVGFWALHLPTTHRSQDKWIILSLVLFCTDYASLIFFFFFFPLLSKVDTYLLSIESLSSSTHRAHTIVSSNVPDFSLPFNLWNISIVLSQARKSCYKTMHPGKSKILISLLIHSEMWRRGKLSSPSYP